MRPPVGNHPYVSLNKTLYTEGDFRFRPSNLLQMLIRYQIMLA